MKIAISGKGGVGKSTVAAAFILLMARRGMRVLAIDADPDANLAAALGIAEKERRKIVPISKQRELIEERTGAKVRQYGQMFKLNPEVADIAEKYAYVHNGIALLVLGAIEQGGSGCACPESVLIRHLVADLILYKDDALVMDMEAGIEHLGRSTVSGVDTLLVVIEPGQRSLESAQRIRQMAHDIGLDKIKYIANKVAGSGDEAFIRKALPEGDIIGVIPYSDKLRRIDRDGMSVVDGMDKALYATFENMLDKLIDISKH